MIARITSEDRAHILKVQLEDGYTASKALCKQLGVSPNYGAVLEARHKAKEAAEGKTDGA